MAQFRKMVSMSRTPAEKVEAMMDFMPSATDMPNVPYGLCICLTDVELEKLDLDGDCDVGDTIHLFALAKVTSVSKQDTGDGEKCRIELSLTDVAVESEDEENEEESDDE